MFSRHTDPDVTVDNGLLVVDGEVLEEVLAEVYQRCGADARILRADRSIVGGIAGFFGRETFHVVARPANDDDRAERAAAADRDPDSTDPDSTDPDSADPDRAVRGDGPLDGPTFAAALAEALHTTMDGEDRIADLLPLDGDPATELTGVRSAAVASRASAAASRASAAASVAAAASAGYGVPTPPDWSATPVDAPLAPVVPLRWDSTPATEQLPELPPLPQALHTAPRTSALARPASTVEPASATAPDSAAEPDAAAAEQAPMTPPAAPAAATEVSADSDIPWQPLPSDGPTFRDEHLLAGPTIVLEPSHTTAAARWYDRAADAHGRTLSELELPELLARIDRLLPLNVSRPPSGVVAVVGDAEDAVTTARRLAQWSRRPEQSSVVLLAPDLRSRDSSRVVVTSLALAADQRNRWARRPGTTFVAVALDPGDAGSAWVRRALEVLDPAQVRYAAPAWRSAGEVLERVTAVGGVDCLDLVHLDQSSEPAQFLSMEPPVATVDGRPASPELWAAHLLAARRTAAPTDVDAGSSHRDSDSRDDSHSPSPRHEFGGTA